MILFMRIILFLCAASAAAEPGETDGVELRLSLTEAALRQTNLKLQATEAAYEDMARRMRDMERHLESFSRTRPQLEELHGRTKALEEHLFAPHKAGKLTEEERRRAAEAEVNDDGYVGDAHHWP